MSSIRYTGITPNLRFLCGGNNGAYKNSVQMFSLEAVFYPDTVQKNSGIFSGILSTEEETVTETRCLKLRENTIIRHLAPEPDPDTGEDVWITTPMVNMADLWFSRNVPNGYPDNYDYDYISVLARWGQC